MTPTNLVVGNQYCVATIGQTGIAIPALAVREVMSCPHIYQVPLANPVLIGLSHIRNDFVPVLSVSQFLGMGDSNDPARASLVLMNGVDGSWAFTVDQACAVVPLETAHVRDAGVDDEFSSIITGTATFRDSVVRVLDADALYRVASAWMQLDWSTSTTLSS